MAATRQPHSLDAHRVCSEAESDQSGHLGTDGGRCQWTQVAVT